MSSNKLPQIIVAQLGARRHYSIPVTLNRAGMLAHFYTDAYSGPGSWLAPLTRLMPRSFLKNGIARLAGRTARIPAGRVTAFNRLMFKWIMAYKETDIRKQYQMISNISISFNYLILKRIFSLQRFDAIYGYDRASLELFWWAKKNNKFTILDQSCIPWKVNCNLLENANKQFPGWEDTPRFLDFQFLSQREEQEWHLADLIFCGSLNVKESLQKCGVKPNKIVVLPSGLDINYWGGKSRSFSGKTMLKLLFVGSGGTSKGVPVLLEALKKLPCQNIELSVVGNLNLNGEKIAQFSNLVKIIGRVPRTEIKLFYNANHVFVFPSFSEGSAEVTYEALAAGLPVITTPQSGSVVRDGIEGFIVPSGDVEALATAIDRFLKKPEMVAVMSRNALARARDFSLDRYGERLISIICQKLYEG